MKFDAFLSHASEDKALLVRPLADRLASLGLSVVYDEYTFRLGDSLVSSIDSGISASNSGVIVLSQHFFVKPWPENEKNALVNRMVMDQDFMLIPIWHGVSREEVAAFSQTLADRIALTTTDKSIEELAFQLAKRIRPDLLTAIVRRAEFDLALSKREREPVAVSDLAAGPVIHAALPSSYVNRIRVVASTFESVSGLNFNSTIEAYQRDLYPEIEIRVWERMAACYLETCRGMQVDDPARPSIYKALLGVSIAPERVEELLAELEPDILLRLKAAISFRAPWDQPESS